MAAQQRVRNLIYNDSDEEYSAFEDSDDELAEEVYRRPRWIRERQNFFDDYDEKDFVTHFRLSKKSTLHVLEQIENRLEFLTDR